MCTVLSEVTACRAPGFPFSRSFLILDNYTAYVLQFFFSIHNIQLFMECKTMFLLLFLLGAFVDRQSPLYEVNIHFFKTYYSLSNLVEFRKLYPEMENALDTV